MTQQRQNPETQAYAHQTPALNDISGLEIDLLSTWSLTTTKMLANQMNSHYLNQGNLIYSINADQSNILSYYRPIKYTVLPHMYQIYLLYAGQSNKSKTKGWSNITAEELNSSSQWRTKYTSLMWEYQISPINVWEPCTYAIPTQVESHKECDEVHRTVAYQYQSRHKLPDCIAVLLSTILSPYPTPKSQSSMT